ncbi:hypothetical protein [Pseudomonas rhizoryzae]|uniref:hypothetical protein n=1 Tax=Pseudomonas rhizoryzae TaxID=2571129 RepID=UPI0009BCE8F2|nr:hypothetical protein [Pseudomonas rhizoryzae]
MHGVATEVDVPLSQEARLVTGSSRADLGRGWHGQPTVLVRAVRARRPPRAEADPSPKCTR